MFYSASAYSSILLWTTLNFFNFFSSRWWSQDILFQYFFLSIEDGLCIVVLEIRCSRFKISSQAYGLFIHRFSQSEFKTHQFFWQFLDWYNYRNRESMIGWMFLRKIHGRFPIGILEGCRGGLCFDCLGYLLYLTWRLMRIT